MKYLWKKISNNFENKYKFEKVQKLILYYIQNFLYIFPYLTRNISKFVFFRQKNIFCFLK